jgi:hypothetical protein
MAVKSDDSFQHRVAHLYVIIGSNYYTDQILHNAVSSDTPYIFTQCGVCWWGLEVVVKCGGGGGGGGR